MDKVAKTKRTATSPSNIYTFLQVWTCANCQILVDFEDPDILLAIDTMMVLEYQEVTTLQKLAPKRPAPLPSKIVKFLAVGIYAKVRILGASKDPDILLAIDVV